MHIVSMCLVSISMLTRWKLADDVVELEEGAAIEEWLREHDATLSNSGNSTAVDLSIHTGEANITRWRTIPAIGHVTIDCNVGWENLNATGQEVRQRTAAKNTKLCYAKANWKRFNAKIDKAYLDYAENAV